MGLPVRQRHLLCSFAHISAVFVGSSVAGALAVVLQHARLLAGTVADPLHRRPQVMELRKRTDNLPDDYLVVFVGDMITEEALPTYMTMLNTLDGAHSLLHSFSTPGCCVASEIVHGRLRADTRVLCCSAERPCLHGHVHHLVLTGGIECSR